MEINRIQYNFVKVHINNISIINRWLQPLVGHCNILNQVPSQNTLYVRLHCELAALFLDILGPAKPEANFKGSVFIK